MIQETNKKIEEELKKNKTERNYDNIEELTNAYLYASGLESQVEEAKKRCLANLPKTIPTKKWKMARKPKWTFIAVGIITSILAMNAVTVSAFKMNLFSVAIHIINGEFSVNFPIKVNQEDVIISPDAETSNYDMTAICEEYNFKPEVFHYIPSEFVCINYEYSEKLQHITFTWVDEKNKNRRILFSCRYFDDPDEMKYVSIPNEEHKFEEITVNGSPAIFSNDAQTQEFTLVYSSKVNYWCQISSWSLEYEEMKKIIDSIY